MIILGIDPGYAITGYGIVEYKGNKFSIIDYGAVTTPANMVFSKRLLIIYNQINELIKKYDINFMAVEELFFNTNTKTAIKVGHGRGVILLSGSYNNLSVYEYTPLQVKQAVCGYGRAAKSQVQQMVKVLLNLKTIPKPDDVADALAVAICHAHSYNPRFEKEI
ncbi:MAG: crossover junction endodeoxyribonuclease RuvC [Clostridiales bacterium]|nr:crossover junction endodeoxyribonuclease RuvC [Clostridiales bacterium]